MRVPLDPASAGFLLAENRNQPMHVGGLQLFERPTGAGRDYAREMYDAMVDAERMRPLFLKRPHRSWSTGGQWVWTEDAQFDIEYHVRHSALPKPGRVRELLDLCSRLHGTRLAVYTKMHHALVDGVSAMRLLQSVLSTDPGERGMAPPWAEDAPLPESAGQTATEGELSWSALSSALGIAADAAGLPLALARTLGRGLRNETSPVSLHAPRTILNTRITGSRRFAAQDWPVERINAVGKATGATINDVVLAMCSGALRAYLLEQDALPESTLIAMVPVGLNAKEVQVASAQGGNAVGCVMVRLGTDLDDAGDRLRAVRRSMREGKEALRSMTPNQVLAMSALGLAPAVVGPMLRLHGLARPPFNLVISNVPGPRAPHYFNGARLQGMYPLWIPIHGMALNVTCTSYAGQMGFGLTGCRRSLPHLQRLLTHLEDELAALEKAADVR